MKHNFKIESIFFKVLYFWKIELYLNCSLLTSVSRLNMCENKWALSYNLWKILSWKKSIISLKKNRFYNKDGTSTGILISIFNILQENYLMLDRFLDEVVIDKG